ncbi:MAG: DUF4838 domain-containing protein [Candidatus Aminicenantes bacterium]|nr:DUF4838 domain-containing protein [Candidatus Aminicenantes bacterium]
MKNIVFRARLWGILAALFVFGTVFSPALDAKVVIAKGGKAVARIIVSSTADETEKYAAWRLGFFLHIVTEGDFPVSTEPADATYRLLVGEGAARLAEPDFRSSALQPEEIVIRTQGKGLILAGGSPRGTLYAVFTFLEDIVGCRFWTSSAWSIPWKRSLSVDTLAVRYAPPFEYREPFWFVAFDPQWSAWNKANGIQAGGDATCGGRHIYEGFVHTFYGLIPPDKYFRDHPEWFSEIEGKRTYDKAQLCLTNNEMREELVKNLKEKLRANPQATIASVSQNDCINPCTCARCRAVDEEEGSPSGALLRFVNAVAAAIKAEFPQVTIDTLAYQYTRKPPRLVRPRPNVIVRLCSIECSFARPLDNPVNKSFLDDLEGWARIADRLFIWDYTTNFAHYIQPHPNYPVLAHNIRLFGKNNVRGVFEQGAYQSWGSEMAELRAWLLARLLWNPAADAERLKHEFLEGYYGPMAPQVAAYLTLLEKAVAATDDKLGCYSPPEAKFLSLETALKAWGLLQKAEKKGRPFVEYGRRIRCVQMPVAYVVLVKWDAFRKEAADRGRPWPWPSSKGELLEWFLAAARSEGVTMISEWQKLDDWAAAMRKGS